MRLLFEDCRVLGAETRSVYVDGDIIARTSDSPTQTVPSDTTRINGNGATLLPGLVDTHCHPFENGWLKRNLDLRGTSNLTGLRLRVSAGLTRVGPGRWILGRGWDHEAFPGAKLPTKKDIDDITPRNPVALTRVDGHMALLNSKAIETLGFEHKQGSEYERGPDGKLSGIVKESAVEEVYAGLPRSTEASGADLLNFEVEAMRFGLTKVHCIVSPAGFKEELESLSSLWASGSLSIGYRVYVPPEAIEHIEARGLLNRLNDESVKIRGVKIYADGSLGSRTAALREPYADDPGNRGLLRYSEERLSDLVERADSKGYQVVIHAIGDRAIEQAIYAISRVSGGRNERRHRIDHASLLPKDLRSKMVKYDVRASVQPSFITSDSWAVSRLGDERALDLYPFRSMVREGILVSGGSDSPVESLSPIIGAWAAMARAGIAPGEALTMEEAIAIYTSCAESNGGDPEIYAREGDPANLTLLDSNVEGMHPALFRKVGVSATMNAGELVYSAAG